MSCDKLVYDLAQEVEGSPNVFIRKDWLNILDNQNQNYQNNQSIIDTSQLANSNKYMAYREAYLAVPMVLSMRYYYNGTTNLQAVAQNLTPSDYSIGLKNWFGNIIHSLTLDYNGTTIVQQTPFSNMWNIFKLITTLSYNDLITQGSTIGFYPDTSDSYGYFLGNVNNSNGSLLCNNDLGLCSEGALWVSQSYNQWTDLSNGAAVANGKQTSGGNVGLYKRMKWINFDVFNNNTVAGAQIGQDATANAANASMIPYSSYGISSGNLNQIWKSNVFRKANLITSGAGAITSEPVVQIAVMATIYLKHIHSFFNMCPLLKGVFMKLTLNLNNSRYDLNLPSIAAAGNYSVYSVGENPTALSQCYVGGVQPLMIPSINTGNRWLKAITGGANQSSTATIYYDITVGARVNNADIIRQNTSLGINSQALTEASNISKSIYLYIPAYTFNPTFEQAYLSNSVKQIKYTDIYQYQVLGVNASSNFNNLITNGIANIKSVLIVPFYSKVDAAGTLDDGVNYSEFLSPFDPAGCGCTAPLVSLGNFNIQISGQNAIYNMQRYTFEEWNNQLYGQNAVNGGLTDGLTSGLIGFSDFQQSYCYYYVNVERMLPVEQSVPKSVQILGTNYSRKTLNLWVFVEYGVEVRIDVLTGARV